MRKKKSIRILLCLATFLVFCSFYCSQKFIKVAIPKIDGASYSGDQSCVDCHEEISTEFKKSIHGRLAKFEASGKRKGCESCHGPGSQHVDEEDPEKILSFSSLKSAEKSEICLVCHNKANWRSSEHPLNDKDCTSCHNIHGKSKGKLLAKSEPKLCYDCHKDIQAKTLYPSHHPIWETERTGRKRMICSDCHDVHGSPVKGLKTAVSSNDLCFKCHTKYQGPFIYEHAPVVEDCNICHEPHGTVANNLLRQNEPFICLQCHELHFHVGKDSVAGDFSSPAHQGILEDNSNEKPVNHGAFPQHGMKRAFATKCTQCHSQIHGSDMPSQSVSGRGNSLTR